MDLRPAVSLEVSSTALRKADDLLAIPVVFPFILVRFLGLTATQLSSLSCDGDSSTIDIRDSVQMCGVFYVSH